MSAFVVNGTSLESVERGSGETVVLVHGSASDRRTWENQIEVLGRHFRVVAYSRRYHWPNEPIPEGADYPMMQQVDDLGAVLRQLEGGRVHLVGHSYGAFLCLLLAVREPDLLKSLVLAEPPVVTLFVSNPPRLRELLRLLATRPRTAAAIIRFIVRGVVPASAAIRKGDVDRSIRTFGTAILGRAALEALSERRMQQVRANFIKAELLGSGFAPIDEKEVRGVKVPTLLVNARRSPRMFHRLADRLEELLPNAKRVEIDGASHIMHEDNAEAYNKAVLSFLRSV
jgi:pimeloyl-ACP methyl ester carboxylesterase